MSSSRHQSQLSQKGKFPRPKLGLALILFGLFCLTGVSLFIGYQTRERQSVAFSQLPQLGESLPKFSLPARLVISGVGIDLPISAAKASQEIWEVSEEGASYLLGSGVPGQKGNVIIYGHNKNSLLGPIRWLGKGEEIKIINAADQEFTYRIEETKTVSPEVIEVLLPTEEATLTLYTCTGFLDRERFVVMAKLKD